LTPERNAACPCGSGKKYKRCCGSVAVPRPDYIAINRAVAYRGAVGGMRESFCRAYNDLKTSRFAEISEKVKQETAAAGETLSCASGCAYCCSHFVQASFLESECVVYYLYRHEAALKNFLGAYPRWREGAEDTGAVFKRLNELGWKIAAGRASEEERQAFRESTRAYKNRQIDCPFLAGGACSIYEVRPYVCAGYFSVSPREWCLASHPKNHEAMHLKISLSLGKDVSYFTEIKANPLYALPLMVHQVLEGGYGAIAKITGAESLPGMALDDPGMRAALREAGALGS